MLGLLQEGGRYTDLSLTNHSTHPQKWGRKQCSRSLCKDRLLSGTKGRAETSSGHRRGVEGLTQGVYKCQVLQHHILVQTSLSLIKETPFFPGEVHGHVFKGHPALAGGGQRKSQKHPLPRTIPIFPPTSIYPMPILP